MLARKSSSEIALTRPSAWDGGICKINHLYDFARDTTDDQQNLCEPTELQLPKRRTRGWRILLPYQSWMKLVGLLRGTPIPSGCCQGWLTDSC
jgi:hypothetical protein